MIITMKQTNNKQDSISSSMYNLIFICILDTLTGRLYIFSIHYRNLSQK